MWQHMVQPDVAENTQFSCQIIHVKILYYFFHGHNGYANVPPCYVVRALPILLNYLDAFGGIYQMYLLVNSVYNYVTIMFYAYVFFNKGCIRFLALAP
jgi:hypothetical protein